MHGLVHKTLKEYVVAKTNEDSWRTIRERAGLEPALYLPISDYPDEDVGAIVETLAAMSGHDAARIERDFGRYLASALLQTFGAHVDADWSLVEFLLSVERVVAEVDAKNDATTTPTLSSEREDETTVVVGYRSDRDHCAIAHGVLEGFVGEYRERARVTETACVRDGDDRCAFRVSLE